MQNNGKIQQKQTSGKNNFTWSSVFWLAMALIAFFYLMKMFETQDSVNLSYTEFKPQVKKGKV